MTLIKEIVEKYSYYYCCTFFWLEFVKIRSVPAKNTEKLNQSINTTIACVIEAIYGHMLYEMEYQLNLFQLTNSLQIENIKIGDM